MWGSVLPSDRTALVSEEVQLVGAQIHSRRTAMNLLGNVDQARELELMLQEGHLGFGSLAPESQGSTSSESGAETRRVQ